MEFRLNQEELHILQTIKKLNDRGEKTDYYQVVEEAGADTGLTVPVIARLEDDGYITTNGIIYRYCHITDKGRKTLTDNNMD